MKKCKFLAWLMVLAMVVTLLPVGNVAKAEEGLGTVKVIIENTTFAKADGAAWEGTYEAEVALEAADDINTLIEKAAKKLEFSCSVVPSYYGGTYLSEVNGLKEGDYTDPNAAYSMSGWTGTLNGWFTDMGFSNYTVENKGVKAGDVIKVMYSCDGGPDVGNDYNNPTTALKTIGNKSGSIEETFAADKLSYTIIVAKSQSSLVLNPVAELGSCQVRIFVNEYDVKSDKYYLAGDEVPVKDGDVIYIGVGEIGWPGGANSYDANWNPTQLPGTKYEIKVISAEKVADKEETTKADTTAKEDLKEAMSAVEKTSPEFGAEWYVIDTVKAGKVTDAYKESYYKSVVEKVKAAKDGKIDEKYATTNARVALALSALGYDATDVEGVDLIAPLGDMAYLSAGGVYGPIYALLAIDSKSYDDPSDKVTRETLVSEILKCQTEDGSFEYSAGSGWGGDVDTTAMALQALAPYYNPKAKSVDSQAVNAAVDKALAYLANVQLMDGAFGYGDKSNAESTAQVIIALVALGKDPAKELVTNGYSVLAGLNSFSLGNGKFSHEDKTTENAMATEQAIRALVAYSTLVNGQNSLYDFNVEDPTPESTPTPEVTPVERPVPETGDTSSLAICLIAMMGAALVAAGAKRQAR